jgi:hypothetical protein
MKSYLAIFILILLTGCLPEQAVRKAGLSDSTQNPNPTQVSQSNVELAWYQSLTTSTTLSLFRDATESSYIRGRRIENFLLRENNPTANYCLEIDMGVPQVNADKRFLRVRATPMSVNDIASQTRTIYLRVDFGNGSSNQSVCGNLSKIEYINDNDTQFVDNATFGVQVSTNLQGVRSNSSFQILSTSFKLYKVIDQIQPMTQIKPTDLNLSLLTLALQPGNAPNGGGSCSNSSCIALGFNCCLSNQCVRDGAVKEGVNMTSTSFLSAEQEKLSDPLAFLRYPQFYYICGTNQTTPPAGSGGSQSDANAAAAARLLQMQKDYACIQHLKDKSIATPFHDAPFNTSATYNQDICNTTLNTADYFWRKVLQRLYSNCGCDPVYTSLDDQIANCPKFDYNVLASNPQGQPIEFACTAVDESGVESPFQNLDVTVNSKTVPHRFFDNTAQGLEVNPQQEQINGTTKTQEGQAFSYADQEFTQPQNGSFNMNSILGSFNIDLTGSMPARIVNIEVDNVYLIATRSGYYTPCPTCANDSWFPSFRSHPSSGQGVGLQAVGHSTSKDSWDNNITFGNSEDTIFGRACWVPPTMLPFSQPETGAPGSSTAAESRRTRLRTQATLWMNGYQRDWYGFNKGALIGSFDGVNWFAIGKGRIVRSTTNRLFLAINAPFGDLAENNTHVISVQAYEGQSTGALLDFDPQYVQNHPNQNEAGNCQAYHRCNVDSDCITRLGWEYTCADVTQIQSWRPGFDPLGAGELNDLNSVKTVESLLVQGVLPTGSPKRCVYRGAGAVCRVNSGNILTTEIEKRKLLTCAPNFWCASVDSTNVNIPGTTTKLNVFNSQVARFAAPLEELPVLNNHIYGLDANMLGRPLDYVHHELGSVRSKLVQNLDANVARTIRDNARLIDPSIGSQVGICRPGKRLPTTTDITSLWNPFEQHRGLDSFSRTDYINQIASCPAAPLALGTDKLSSCPVLGDDGNYLHQSTAFASMNRFVWVDRAREQNSCGLETLLTGTNVAAGVAASTLQNSSPFIAIEGKPLNSTIIANPNVTRDACLRKAGAVCHTDLDCGPNKLHADQTQYFNNQYFGNQPNREYYEQYLVCGQGDAKPFLNDENFGDFDITKNRCCREVGQDITTYTADSPAVIAPTPNEPLTETLNPVVYGSANPVNPDRYERFSHIRNFPSPDRPVLNAFSNRLGTGFIDFTQYAPLTPLVNVETPKQWMTLNDANSKTCCGGGWIRKFRDGTTDWSRRDRLQVDVNNFKCLNYYTPLINTPVDSGLNIEQPFIDVEMNKYCFDISGATGNCAQLSIAQGNPSNVGCFSQEVPFASNLFTLPFKSEFSTLAGAVPWSGGTPFPVDSGGGFPANLFSFFPPLSSDQNPETEIDFNNTNASARRNIQFYIPAYVGDDTGLATGDMSNITIHLQRFDSSNNLTERTIAWGPNGLGGALALASPTSIGNCNPGGIAHGGCYDYDPLSRRLRVAIYVGNPFFFNATSRYGVRVRYQAPGTGTNLATPKAKKSCSDVHYLNILGKFELSGIPQITHEKIVCNNDSQKLVPGLYSNTVSTVADFNDSAFSYQIPGGKFKTNYHGLANEPIFASHDFKCCTPVGKITKTPSACCSGQGTLDESGPPTNRLNYKCTLPSGTNLSVYFNRFVSNEGQGDHLNSTPLVTADFNEQTGEPLVNSTVNSKIVAIGREVCASGEIRRGGAFGEFGVQPSSAGSQGATVYGIVDSSSDIGTNSSGGGTDNVGYTEFINGFRWNHHIYCR